MTPSGWSFWLLLGGSWALLMAQLGRYWLNDPQYGYGLVVPFLCGALIWQRALDVRRSTLDEKDKQKAELELAEKGKTSSSEHGALGKNPGFASRVERGAWSGKALFALLLLPLELIRQVTPEVRTIGIAGTIFCFLFTIWALKRLGEQDILKNWGGVFLLFATAVPWPTFLEAPLVQGLMKGVADWSAEISNWFGILAKASGNLIELPKGMVRIDEACSGVRSLQACLMAGVALWQFLGLSWKRGALLVALGQIFALAGNMLRTLVLVWIAANQGTEKVHSFHDPAGWTILAGVTLLLYAAAWRLQLKIRNEKLEISNSRSAHSGPSANHKPRTANSPFRVPSSIERRTLSGKALFALPLPDMRLPLAIAAFSLLSAHAWFWIHEWGHPPRATPGLQIQAGKGITLQKKEVPSSILGTLKPQQGAYYQAHSPWFGRAYIYDFFWAPSPNTRIAFFHRPDVCMPGVGWKPIRSAHEVIIRISERDEQWYVFAFQQGRQKILQAWSAWRDGVSQHLAFEGGWKTFWKDQMQTWGLIRQGRRVASTEIASVALETEPENEGLLYAAVQELFRVDNGIKN